MNESAVFVHGKFAEWEVVGDGIRRQILANGPDLMIVRVDFDAGSVGSTHNHPHRQATYVAAGTFQATVGGNTVTVGAGDSFFAAENVPHGVVALEDGTLIDTFTPARKDLLGKAG